MSEMHRLRKERQLPLSFNNLTNAGGIVIAYLNVQSLHTSLHHIIRDKWYSRCDILILAETWTHPDETIGNISDLNLIYRSDQRFDSKHVNSFKGNGIMCFAKPTVVVMIVEYRQDIDGKNHVDLV